MQRTIIIIVLVLILIGGVYYLISDTKPLEVSATGPATQEVSQNSSTTTPEAATKARASLATTLHVSESDVAIEEIKEMEWSNGCLGIEEKDVFCTEVITPGYRVGLYASGKTYYFRTNTSGTVIKQEK